MGLHINSKHVFGLKLLELVKLVKNATEAIFIEKLDAIVQFLVDYLQNTVYFKNLFRIDIKKIKSLLTSFQYYNKKLATQGIFHVLYRICVHLDSDFNQIDFKPLFENLSKYCMEIFKLSQEGIFNSFGASDSEIYDFFLKTKLFEPLLACLFNPYQQSMDLALDQVWLTKDGFQLSDFFVSPTPPSLGTIGGYVSPSIYTDTSLDLGTCPRTFRGYRPDQTYYGQPPPKYSSRDDLRMSPVHELSSNSNYFGHITDNLWTSDPNLTAANPSNIFSYTSDALFNSTPAFSPTKKGGGEWTVLP